MKLVLATPLYPPDLAEPAPYTKELARRLAEDPRLTVVVVAYGSIPEEVRGVRTRMTRKHSPLPFRLLSFTRALWGEARDADVVYFENGPSVELPLILVSLLSSARILARIGDMPAHVRASTHPFLRSVERIALGRARARIEHSPLPRPEVLPFEPRPTEALEGYERSWKEHLAIVHSHIS